MAEGSVNVHKAVKHCDSKSFVYGIKFLLMRSLSWIWSNFIYPQNRIKADRCCLIR